MREKIQTASFGKASKSGESVTWDEIEIDYLALADAMLSREPRLREAAGRRTSLSSTAAPLKGRTRVASTN